MGQIEYAHLQVFYDANPEREPSPEADYGVQWRGLDGADFPLWRVSFVRDTGDVYATQHRTGVTVLLGKAPVVPEGEGEGPWYRALDDILLGWADACLNRETIQWVSDRVNRG